MSHEWIWSLAGNWRTYTVGDLVEDGQHMAHVIDREDGVEQFALSPMGFTYADQVKRLHDQHHRKLTYPE